ncbi:DUF262 domain-containing protein [Pseudomonas wadenswilerensis]|uniref:GmrSD restriction endonucleases N-terminal domain-containing protein n=1 Tax=Pseudomonas wadenswilerensis TaxID=1785161 RepID=A0A380T1M5_9PSED|nr:DUF262 domain-containing protein [Pseudomonas wadenswilerensis]SUQ64129.1 hypothetical protein CCOS864_03583 [Pseudomonas wadenswilerensis]
MVAKEYFSIRTMDAKPLTWWKSRRSKIDMNPSYQRRGRLWSQTDKGYLIDSILNGFDIPKIYMADFTVGESSKLNSSRLPYAIIDGKQRFEAIFDFFDGSIVLNDDFVYKADPSLKLGGLGYKDLVANHYDVAEIFETFNLTIMEVHASTEDPINELFVRLNRNKPLAGAEIRNAMSGPVPQIIRSISSHSFFTDCIAFSVKRGADLNTAAKLLQFEYSERPMDTKKRVLDEFVQQVEVAQKKQMLELATRRVTDNLDAMAEIFLPRDKLLSSGGIIPVYYWLCREQDSSRHHLIREFLVEFESRRKSNRASASQSMKGGEITSSGQGNTLVAFDILNRSTNDLGSHVGRFKILNDAFEEWVLLNS